VTTAAARLNRARAALERGDLFSAYDIATEQAATEQDAPDDGALAYVEVRALAGMGDWENGLRRYGEAGLDRAGDDVDKLALLGRLLKDAAYAAAPELRAARFAQSCEAYAAIFAQTGEFYVAINAAATAMLSGDQERAARFAEAALAGASAAPHQDYWAAATAAEALLILGRMDEVSAELDRAVTCEGASVSARASTFRQLSALMGKAGIGMDAVSLDPIRPPRTAHICGHMFAADEESEARNAAQIADVLVQERVGAAYGALACGADILFAEQCLALGIEFHAVVPFDEEDFLDLSVRRGEGDWEERYRRCMARATRTYIASAMRYVDDEGQFAFASEVGMGLAKLRATQMGGEAIQIAVWDGKLSTGLAGTGADVRRWLETGGRSIRLDPGPIRRAAGGTARTPAAERPSRAVRVLVFTDFKNFSKLPEPDMPRFWTEVMGRCAAVLQSRLQHVACQNTWGDALYLALDDVRAAAEALVDLRDILGSSDFGSLGLPPGGGMRIAAHFGPVYELVDPVTGRTNYYGTEVSRAARVEPVTPPGQVYVTEPMAAAIELSCADSFACRYVGRMTLPKDFGTERIYRLERR